MRARQTEVAQEVGTCEPSPSGTVHCVTCGDDGEAMTVVSVDPPRGLALCAGDGGTCSTVEVALVEPVAPGQRLLVHAGTAIARLED